jgi:hypothetical protein
VGVWLWGVCARMRAESRFKREILLYNKWTNIYILLVTKTLKIGVG